MATPPLDRPLEDPTTPDAQKFLDGIQANILKGHGRDHAAVLLITLGPSDATARPDKAKEWIRSLAATRITSALKHEQDRTVKPRTVTHMSIALSSRGYEYLSLKRPKNGAFRDGMRERGPILHDPPVTEWDLPYQLDPGNIHALLNIANTDRALIDGVVAQVKTELAAFGGRVLVEERGDQQMNAGEGVEHFGYRDGVSQPVLIKDPKPPVPPGKPEFDQHAPLKLVLAEDPAGPNRFGSYLVFRKLEQNVRGFDKAVVQVAGVLGMDPVLTGAMAIGRFKDGTPVVTDKAPTGAAGDEVDFDFGPDKDGAKCPFHGHIRKTNPRGEIPFLINLFAREQKRRIARRGITYGRRPDLEGAGIAPPETGVGLLFLCYQNDINDQFEFIQKTWANNPNFVKGGAGLDPVIGQSSNPGQVLAEFPNWPKAWGSAQKQRVRFGQFVKLLGGEYFFSPSMETLRTMK